MEVQSTGFSDVSLAQYSQDCIVRTVFSRVELEESHPWRGLTSLQVEREWSYEASKFWMTL